MKDKEITKNLRCCADRYCKGCSMQGEQYCKETVCSLSWDLIQRQMEKIEKLKADLKYYLDNNEENGVVYISKFIVEKRLKEISQ